MEDADDDWSEMDDDEDADYCVVCDQPIRKEETTCWECGQPLHHGCSEPNWNGEDVCGLCG